MHMPLYKYIAPCLISLAYEKLSDMQNRFMNVWMEKESLYNFPTGNVLKDLTPCYNFGYTGEAKFCPRLEHCWNFFKHLTLKEVLSHWDQ